MTEFPLSWLTDAELQARIDRFSKALLAANERYEKSGDICDRVARDAAWISQRAVLKERSRRAHIVAAMEQQRGLA